LEKIASTAQSNLLKRARDSFNSPVSTRSLSWALSQMCCRPWEFLSWPPWVLDQIHSASNLIWYGCVNWLYCWNKKYCRAWEGLTKSDLRKAAARLEHDKDNIRILPLLYRH